MGKSFLCHYTSSDRSERYLLTNVVINCENLTRFKGSVFARQFGVRNMVVKIPQCMELSDNYGFFGLNLRDADFSQWDFSSVRSIGYQWFLNELNYDWGAAKHANGTIKFPSLETLAEGVFLFRNGIAAFELGTGTGKLRQIGIKAFNSTCATNYIMGCASDMTVAPDAFSNCTAAESFSFLNYPPKDAETMDNILASNNRDAMANVYVSRMRSVTWSAYCVPTAEIDDGDVKAQAESSGAVAAFKNAEGVWKAFIYTMKMPCDPAGTVLIIR